MSDVQPLVPVITVTPTPAVALTTATINVGPMSIVAGVAYALHVYQPGGFQNITIPLSPDSNGNAVATLVPALPGGGATFTVDLVKTTVAVAATTQVTVVGGAS